MGLGGEGGGQTNARKVLDGHKIHYFREKNINVNNLLTNILNFISYK